MTPDPKAAEDFAKLVLVTARTLRQLITEPINPRRRAKMLTELNDALAPFDAERDGDEGCPVDDPGCYARSDESHETCERPKPHRAHDPGCKSITGHNKSRCDCSLADLSHDNCELPRAPGAP